jgi:hypothetical protein
VFFIADDERERERKIHVEIKPLSNGSAPMSASVDELRATVENLSLSPVAVVSVSILNAQFFSPCRMSLESKVLHMQLDSCILTDTVSVSEYKQSLLKCVITMNSFISEEF